MKNKQLAEDERNDVNELDEGLVEQAKEYLERSDLNLMADALGSNPDKADNLQMGVSLQLKRSLNNLNYNIKRLKKSTDLSSVIMIILTLAILVFTVVLAFRG